MLLSDSCAAMMYREDGALEVSNDLEVVREAVYDAQQRLASLRPERRQADAVADLRVVGQLGDDHPTVGVADQDDRGVEPVEHAADVPCVARQVPQRRRVRARAGQLVHDRHAMSGLLQPLGETLPDLTGAPGPVDEESLMR